MELAENRRSKKVYIKLPWQGLTCFPGVRIVELLCWIYGLSSAPLAWRNTVLAYLRELGFKIHPMTPSVFLFFEKMKVDHTGKFHPVFEAEALPVENGCLGGSLLLQVDDILMAGNGDGFRTAIKKLQKRFDWGKWTDLSQPREFNGRTLQQVLRNQITVSMVQAVSKMRPLQIPSPRERPAASAATEKEITAFRGLLGKIMWSARCAAPQALAAASILASRVPTLKFQDMRDINQALQHLQATVMDIKIIGISPRSGGYAVYSDASLANLEDKRTQVAMVIGRINRDQLRDEGVTTFSLQDYASHKFRQVVNSTLMAETAALVEAL
eukprot:1299118-Amphidinium_carterae.3